MTSSTIHGSSWSDNESRSPYQHLGGGGDNIQEELDGAVRNQVIIKILWQRCARKRTIEIGNNVEQKLKYKASQWTNWKRKVCKFYIELDSILGHWPASVPAVLLSPTPPEPGENSTEEKEMETNGKSYHVLKC